MRQLLDQYDTQERGELRDNNLKFFYEYWLNEIGIKQ